MKGKILEFNIQTNNGIILGNDGKRYSFNGANWKSNQSPSINQEVDFTIENDTAKEIYIISNSQTINQEKSKIVAALLAFFLGAFGIHKFYLNCGGAGAVMLIIGLVGLIFVGIPTAIMGIISFIEMIIYLIKSDEEFNKKYVENKKCWF
jgi:TM2 domain-containing membrane protein YozV